MDRSVETLKCWYCEPGHGPRFQPRLFDYHDRLIGKNWPARTFCDDDCASHFFLQNDILSLSLNTISCNPVGVSESTNSNEVSHQAKVIIASQNKPLSLLLAVAQTIFESRKAQELFKSDEYTKFVDQFQGKSFSFSQNPAEFKAVVAHELYQSLSCQKVTELVARLTLAVGCLNSIGDTVSIQVTQLSLLKLVPETLKLSFLAISETLNTLAAQFLHSEDPGHPRLALSPFLGNAVWQASLVNAQATPTQSLGYTAFLKEESNTTESLILKISTCSEFSLHFLKSQMEYFTVRELRNEILQRLPKEFSVFQNFEIVSTQLFNSASIQKPICRLIEIKMNEVWLVPIIKSGPKTTAISEKKLICCDFMLPQEKVNQNISSLLGGKPNTNVDWFYFYADVECTLKEVLSAIEQMAKIYLEMSGLRGHRFVVSCNQDINRSINSLELTAKNKLPFFSAKIESTDSVKEQPEQVETQVKSSLTPVQPKPVSETPKLSNSSIFFQPNPFMTPGGSASGVGGANPNTKPEEVLATASETQSNAKMVEVLRVETAADTPESSGLARLRLNGLIMMPSPLQKPAASLQPACKQTELPSPGLLIVELQSKVPKSLQILMHRVLEEEVPVHSSTPEVAQGKYCLHAILLKNQDVVETVILKGEGFKTITEPEKNYKYWSNRHGEQDGPLTDAISKAFALVYELRTCNDD